MTTRGQRTNGGVFAVRRIVVVLLIGMLTFAGGVRTVNAAEQFKVSDYWLPAATIHDGGDDAAVRRSGAALASKYDARDYGWVTPVRDQGNYESCWAFSSIAAIETNLIKNGKANLSIDLSENQVAYFFYHRQTDRLGYTSGDYNSTARGDYLSAGGTLQGTGLALATWAGITSEAVSPYMTIPDNSLCYAADYSVKNVYLYNYSTSNLANSVAKIKQAVVDHGAVACGIYMANGYYNQTNYSYYCTQTGGNHAVTIVGWDDSYSADQFNAKPSSNGAWIVKNSYGTAFGNQGYFYVSYEDRSLTEFMSFETVTADEQYDNNYQHDGSANPAYSYNKGDYYANVFKAKGANGCNEELKAIGIYTLTTNTNYEVQIYTGLTNTKKPTSGTKAFSGTVKGSLADAGFQTITLPEPVTLTAGESFSVVVRLLDSSGSGAYIGVDSTYQNSWITFIANVGENQSFVKLGKKWYDFGKEASANFRIKAYTDATTQKSSFRLSEKKLGISKGSSAKLTLQTADYVHRSVKWKSSNRKVATVNQNGKVKAKAYGTATITATFMGGAKKKTLQCKVTVGPGKTKLTKATVKGGKVKLRWKKVSAASGYEIRYASAADGTYKKLASIGKSTTTSYTKKLKKGTWYIKIRAYRLSGTKKLYGSDSAVREVTIP